MFCYNPIVELFNEKNDIACMSICFTDCWLWCLFSCNSPRESEGVCFYRRWFVCLSVILCVCLSLTTITKKIVIVPSKTTHLFTLIKLSKSTHAKVKKSMHNVVNVATDSPHKARYGARLFSSRRCTSDNWRSTVP